MPLPQRGRSSRGFRPRTPEGMQGAARPSTRLCGGESAPQN
nr:MAG TPA: hypothetical protein [Caudoviricetes sp.]